jgi:hypothetical protein
MKFREYIAEKVNTEKERIENIRNVFMKVPGSTPKSIADYVVKTISALGIKPKSDGGTYISGPMTNLPDFYYPVFNVAEKYVGGKVHNPAKFPHSKLLRKNAATLDWGDFMTVDVYYLLRSNKVVVLPGYSNSSGAITEITIGEKVIKVKPSEIKKVIGGKYPDFVEEVKKQYISKGLEAEFNDIIEPMLNAKNEKEAAKRVKAHIPTEGGGERYDESIDEGVKDSIMGFLESVKSKTMEKFLDLIGMIFSKNNVKKVIR